MHVWHQRYWIPDRFATRVIHHVCMIHHEKALRHARSAWGARNAGLSTAFLGPSISARKLHSRCESAMYLWHRRYWIPDRFATRVYGTPRGSTAIRAICAGRKKCWTLDSVPWIEHFSSKITQGANQRCTDGTGVCVACTQHSSKTSWHNSTTLSVLSR